jgi:hypothetical protein
VDADRFDLLARSLVTSSRRGLSRALAGLGIVGGLSPLLGMTDAEAKKKGKNKKKKKKCKGKKKCGKKCIPKTSCCSSAECGNGGTCVSGTCNCLSGFKPCDGACVPDDQCCPACTGDQECENGECVCPLGSHPCNGECISDQLCCTDEECGGIYTCNDGTCLCPNPDDIPCGEDFCCATGMQVCEIASGGVRTCLAGGCPDTDWCIDPETYSCEPGCVCTNTVGPMTGTACVDTEAILLSDCETLCTSSDDCAPNEVCVADGEFCGCGGSFCTPVCGAATLRKAEQGGGAALTDAVAARKGVGVDKGRDKKRRNR